MIEEASEQEGDPDPTLGHFFSVTRSQPYNTSSSSLPHVLFKVSLTLRTLYTPIFPIPMYVHIFFKSIFHYTFPFPLFPKGPIKALVQRRR